MEPLKQFICDKCGGLIEKPEDGYVIWREDNESKLCDIHIVHHNFRDDEGIKHGCDNDRSYPLSDSLEGFLGTRGLVELLALVDPGPYFVREYKERISDKRSFLEFFRRVQIPYYEEARIYWNRARSEGFFADINEIGIYSPEFLKALIEQYKE